MYLAACFETIFSLSCVSGFHSASLNLQANGYTAWGWKTFYQLPTPASAQSTSGLTASGTTTANSFWGRMQCPPFSLRGRIHQRCARLYRLFFCNNSSFSKNKSARSITVNIPQIELRKRGVIPKESNIANQMGTPADRDRVREAASLRRDKRGGLRVSTYI